jgi:protein-ribulosamine 3-kinase
VHHYGPLGGPGRGGSFIVMEYLNFGGRANAAELGRQLALMHLAIPAVGGQASWQASSQV